MRIRASVLRSGRPRQHPKILAKPARFRKIATIFRHNEVVAPGEHAGPEIPLRTGTYAEKHPPKDSAETRTCSAFRPLAKLAGLPVLAERYVVSVL
jgi:hypothetical protein